MKALMRDLGMWQREGRFGGHSRHVLAGDPASAEGTRPEPRRRPQLLEASPVAFELRQRPSGGRPRLGHFYSVLTSALGAAAALPWGPACEPGRPGFKPPRRPASWQQLVPARLGPSQSAPAGFPKPLQPFVRSAVHFKSIY